MTKLNSNVIFNGQKTDLSFEEIKTQVELHGSFSGSINAGNTMFLFSNVKPEEFQYYVDTFKEHVTTQPDTEVTFDIQTNAIQTITI
tara:strand:- start:188 stop:448 length:261 start_codon:yes stop_codon:yes gene_type:complete